MAIFIFIICDMEKKKHFGFVVVSLIFSAIAIVFLLTLDVKHFTEHNYQIFKIIILFIPIVIIQIFYFLSHKLNWSYKTKNSICSILTILNFIYYSILFVLITINSLEEENFIPITPSAENYSKELNVIKEKYSDGTYNHFPEFLPSNISDYYFIIEKSFDGENTDYLKFRTDKSYIDNEMRKECQYKLKKEEINRNYFWINPNKFEYADEYCILHMRNQTETYTTGIAADKEHQIIYYFRINF